MYRYTYPDEEATPGWYQLLHLGPTIEVVVGLHPAEEAAARRDGTEPPAPIRGKALIDTGASFSIVDAGLLRRLQPTIHGTAPLKGYRDEGALECPVFHARIAFNGDVLPPWDAAMAAAPLASKTSDQLVLLGRDFLRRCVLSYDGPAGTVTLRHVG